MPRWAGRQFHNQPVESHQHQFLVDLWAAVARETDGQVAIAVQAQNGGIAGSDPAALEMLRRGELEFFTLMGGILGRAVPVAEIQGLPFAFASHEQVHAANEGPLGAYIGAECAARGIHRFRHGLMENGFRHLVMSAKPIAVADDLAGIRMRVPDGEMFRDLFATLGAEPVTVNISGIYEALKTHHADGHENPLVITEVNRLYEVTRYVSLTGHMWSGFNLLANLRFWQGLPAAAQEVIDRNVRTHVARQRRYTDDLNKALETRLVERGMVLNRADVSSFRAKLGAGFYRRWKERFGVTAWRLLEDAVGRVG